MTRKAKHQSVFSRMAKNVGWLAGSRGFTGLVSIVYLGLAARTLGPPNFGSFTLVLTYGQLIANLVQFQSWKGVIRFGAVHSATNDRARLARLFGFTATLDWASAVVGLALAFAAAPLVAPLLHWNTGEQQAAALFGGVLLLTTGATASGALRLFGRFDLIAYTDAAAPMVRLIGSVAAWIATGGVGTFLIIWAAASAIQFLVLWIAVLFVHGSRLAIGRHAFVMALRENPRILRFMMQTNLANSLGLFWLQLGTLAVGAVAGPAEAGGFRIAQRLAKAIAKPIEPITRALYPELARLVAQGEHSTLRHVLLRVSTIAAALASLIVVATGFGGGEILRLVAGKQFEFAHQFLFLLSIAAAFDLAGFALEPFHNAHGRAGRVLRSNAVGALIYLLLLVLLLRGSRGEGAAIAAIGASLVIFVQLAVSAFQILDKTNRLKSRTGILEEEARSSDATAVQTESP